MRGRHRPRPVSGRSCKVPARGVRLFLPVEGTPPGGRQPCYVPWAVLQPQCRRPPSCQGVAARSARVPPAPGARHHLHPSPSASPLLREPKPQRFSRRSRLFNI